MVPNSDRVDETKHEAQSCVCDRHLRRLMFIIPGEWDPCDRGHHLFCSPLPSIGCCHPRGNGPGAARVCTLLVGALWYLEDPNPHPNSGAPRVVAGAVTGRQRPPGAPAGWALIAAAGTWAAGRLVGVPAVKADRAAWGTGWGATVRRWPHLPRCGVRTQSGVGAAAVR